MFCQECKTRPATVHLTRVIGDEVEQMHLCAQCAREKGELQFFDPATMIQNLLANFVSVQQVEVQEVPPCPTCGFSFGEFRASGRLGCPACYAHFHKQLEPILRRLHGTTDHRGKLPARRGVHHRRGQKVAQLKELLAHAVAHEEFEEAARLRDELRSLESGGGAE